MKLLGQLDKNKQRIVIGAAGAVLFLVLLMAALAGLKTERLNDRLPALVNSPFDSLSSSAPELVMKQRRQKALLKQPWGRNPFSVPSGETSSNAYLQALSGSDFSLTGILHRNSHKVAILNRMFVREGDLIHGARVVSIGRDHVILRKDGKEIFLRLEPL